MSLQSALAFTLQAEGGYVNNPRDPGGATNYGITQRVLDAWQTSHGLPREPVSEITTETRDAIYAHDYWTPAHCDAMPDKLGMCVFDFAVNSGVHQAIVTLQRCLGTGPDGRWGAKTAAVLASYLDKIGEPALIAAYLDARRDFLQDIVERNPGEHVFLADWLGRCDRLQGATA